MLFGLFGTKSTHIPKWVSFARTVEGKPYSLSIDTGYQSLLEQKEYRNILVVSFASQHPDGQGVPSAEEQLSVAKGAKKIGAALGSLTPTFFLGTVSGNAAILLYYAALQPVDEGALKEALSSIPLIHTITWADDSGWSFIQSTIYPTDKERQRTVNGPMLEIVKVEQGKDSEMAGPQGIAHTIFLKTHQDGINIADALKADGYYQVGDIQIIKNPGKSEYLYVMELGKNDILSIETVNQQTDTVIDAIQKYNAKYDGWQAIQGGR